MHPTPVGYDANSLIGISGRIASRTGRDVLRSVDPARVCSLIPFERVIHDLDFERVAVISGSASEPELAFIPGDCRVAFLNFEDDPELFDLDLDWSESRWRAYHDRYELVLCEHVRNPQRAVSNLRQLLRTGGMLHISAPALNGRHGLPNYYYAGLSPEILSHWVKNAGLVANSASSWGSSKAARMCATCDWQPLAVSGSFSLFWAYFQSNRESWAAILSTLRLRLRHSVRYPFQPPVSVQSGDAVISGVFAVRP